MVDLKVQTSWPKMKADKLSTFCKIEPIMELISGLQGTKLIITAPS